VTPFFAPMFCTDAPIRGSFAHQGELVAVFHRFSEPRVETHCTRFPFWLLTGYPAYASNVSRARTLLRLVVPRAPERPLSLVDFSGKPLSERLFGVWNETAFRFGCFRSLVGRQPSLVPRAAADPGPIERRPNFPIKDGLQFSPTQCVAHSRRQQRSSSPGTTATAFFGGESSSSRSGHRLSV
jgi:hypothetical protein